MEGGAFALVDPKQMEWVNSSAGKWRWKQKIHLPCLPHAILRWINRRLKIWELFCLFSRIKDQRQTNDFPAVVYFAGALLAAGASCPGALPAGLADSVALPHCGHRRWRCTGVPASRHHASSTGAGRTQGVALTG